MDRLDAMHVFVSALDEGSLAGAGRRLGRSPAAITRAIAGLEAQVGARLLERTTRIMRLTEAGERYAAVCRRVLVDIEEAEMQAAGERSAPRGVLTLTAPLLAGTRLLRPVVDAFLTMHPAVQVRLRLLDRVVNLLEEGIDLALRIAHLPDSSLIAIRVGAVRQVICASPAYLASRPALCEPADLALHDCIGLTEASGGELWHFPPAAAGGKPRLVRVRAQFSVNIVQAAIDSAIEGCGLARVLSYQIEDELRDGRLVLVLDDHASAPWPVHLVAPEGRLAVAKVRAFADFAGPRLKARFATLSAG